MASPLKTRMAGSAVALVAAVFAGCVLTSCSGTSPAPTPTTVTTLASIPPTSVQPEHNVGDDCSDGRIVAQWGLTADGRWVCVPKEQATSTEPTPPTSAGEPGGR
ncbi:hypothetical protein ABZ412_33840 [Nocardia sp. NPDC005746]|uniref:hypothetical protein n=1 Tax=Nocardia sp. NPDC005746 TaxID=3157062 RepID=UPI0033F9B8EC